MNKLFLLLFVLFVLPGISSAADTLKTKSGIKYVVLKKGTGVKAENGKVASIHYEGWLTNGKRFDSSRRRQSPNDILVGAGHVIKGWDEIIAMMRVGDDWKVIIPPSMAYGKEGIFGVIPENATLIFEMELMGVREPKKSLSDTLFKVITASGFEAGTSLFSDIKANHSDDYEMKETELNGLGYKLLYDERRTDDAIEVFKWNVEMYPESFNVYDSLGEGYMMKGDKENAILNYERSVQINPDNEAGKRALLQLRGY